MAIRSLAIACYSCLHSYYIFIVLSPWGKISTDVGVGEVVMIVADSANGKIKLEAVAGLVTSVVVMRYELLVNVGVAIVLVGAMVRMDFDVNVMFATSLATSLPT